VLKGLSQAPTWKGMLLSEYSADYTSPFRQFTQPWEIAAPTATTRAIFTDVSSTHTCLALLHTVCHHSDSATSTDPSPGSIQKPRSTQLSHQVDGFLLLKWEYYCLHSPVASMTTQHHDSSSPACPRTHTILNSTQLSSAHKRYRPMLDDTSSITHRSLTMHE
jgi:hypothetical protein